MNILNYLSNKNGVSIIKNYKHPTLCYDWGNAAINHTDMSVEYTRSIEHKHFEFKKSDTTIVTFEYPEKWDKTKTPLYPVNDDKNSAIYKAYSRLAKIDAPDVIFGGRLAEYRYYDMHQVIGSALVKAERVLGD